jgi:hypothetical protein
VIPHGVTLITFSLQSIYLSSYGFLFFPTVNH